MVKIIKFLQDFYIHAGVVISFLLLLLIKIKVQAPPEISDWYIVVLFSSKIFEDVSGNILSSVIAAYIFYIFIEFIPAQKRLQQTKLTLDNLLNSIVLSYEKKHGSPPPFEFGQHNHRRLEKDHIDRLIYKLQNEDGDYSGLYSAALHAKNIIKAMEQGTYLAASLSSEHSIFWTQITAKVCELAGMVKERPKHEIFIPEDVFYSTSNLHKLARGNKTFYYRSIQHKERIKSRLWLLLDDITYWKVNYSQIE